MINKDLIFKHVISNLTKAGDWKNDPEHLQRAFNLGSVDLATKFKEAGRMTSHTVTVTANDREKILTGGDYDLENIYFILYGTGSDQSPIYYRPLAEFLKNYSNPSADAGTPEYWTLLGLDKNTGFPKIKFDKPAESSTTMEVYYFSEVSPTDIRDAQGPALINVTIAYYYGTGSQKGWGYYAAFKANVADVRASGKKVEDPDSQFCQNDFDRQIAIIRMSRRSNRR